MSPDGVTRWKRLAANPLVAPTPGSWDSEAVYKPSAMMDAERGRWILCKEQHGVDNDNNNYAYFCSQCHYQDVHSKYAKVNFCWNCGAQMDLRTPTEVQLDIADSVMMGEVAE